MSVPNRQIGWSNESNLLWNISKQLEKLNGVVAATAAGGMLNPTTNYIPFNSGLAFGDSYLVNDTDILKTVWNTVDKGLKLDFLNEQYTLGRDSTEFLRVQTELIYTNYGGNDTGLKLDFANNQYKLGDFSAVSSNSFLNIDAGLERIEIGADLITTSAAGAASGQYLKIKVGAVDYKIAILNNA